MKDARYYIERLGLTVGPREAGLETNGIPCIAALHTYGGVRSYSRETSINSGDTLTSLSIAVFSPCRTHSTLGPDQFSFDGLRLSGIWLRVIISTKSL